MLLLHSVYAMQIKSYKHAITGMSKLILAIKCKYAQGLGNYYTQVTLLLLTFFSTAEQLDDTQQDN